MDVDWPIPGLSRWGSKNAKTFLHSLVSTHLWTRHVYVAADNTDTTIQPLLIERTIWEGRTLLFSVQGHPTLNPHALALPLLPGLDHWLRVEEGGSHFVYWPCMLLVGCLGTHMHNGRV